MERLGLLDKSSGAARKAAPCEATHSGRMKLTTCLVTLAATLVSTAAFADSPLPGAFAEVNVAPYVFHGYSGFVGYHRSHFHVGGGVYAFTLPDFIRDSGFENADGLTIKSKLGIGLFGRYFVNAKGTGFYGALQLGWERFGVSKEAMPGVENRVFETYIDPYVGYLWKPFASNGLFVNPNFGVAFSTTTSGAFSLDGQAYKFKGFVPLLFLQIGYEL
jgi:hypothetical protein